MQVACVALRAYGRHKALRCRSATCPVIVCGGEQAARRRFGSSAGKATHRQQPGHDTARSNNNPEVLSPPSRLMPTFGTYAKLFSGQVDVGRRLQSQVSCEVREWRREKQVIHGEVLCHAQHR